MFNITFNRGDAQKAMSDWMLGYPQLPSLDSEYLPVRENIQELNKRVRASAMKLQDPGRDDYYIDANLGLELYNYFWSIKGFTLRTASDDDFWRYLSLKVAPDVVAQRWGKDNESHYWTMPSRIWFRSIWWYIHLAWQGNVESTKDLINCKHFTTDTILNFEERTGRKGTYVEAYRKILYYYGIIPDNVVRHYKKASASGNDDLFRVVMKLNTAKLLVIDPILYPGGVDGYARMLFHDAGVEIDAT